MPPLESVSEKTERQGSSPQGNLLQALGQISFINALPVVLPLQRGLVELGCPMEFGTPSELNQKLNRKELHMGAMSSYFFLQNGSFELFKNISISGRGKVGSVLLFSKVELSKLQNKQIMVPRSSATSTKLLELLLKDEFGISAELSSVDDKQPALEDAEAILLIGDKALASDQKLSRTHLRVDLAQWWYRRFSLPFVFGVWGARKDWVQSNQDEYRRISQALVHSSQLGLGDFFEDVLDAAQLRCGLSEERLRCYYLDELDYRLGPDHERALKLFAELCAKHKLI